MPTSKEQAAVHTRIASEIQREYFATAYELFHHFFRTYPNEPFNRPFYVETLTALGFLGNAEKLLLELVGTDPKESHFTLMLARLYKRLGAFESAEAYFKKTIATKPNDTTGIIFYGTFLSRQQRHQEAIALFESNLNAEGDRDELYYNYGVCFESLGDYITAKRHYRRALQFDNSFKTASLALDDLDMATRISNWAELNLSGNIPPDDWPDFFHEISESETANDVSDDDVPAGDLKPQLMKLITQAASCKRRVSSCVELIKVYKKLFGENPGLNYRDAIQMSRLMNSKKAIHILRAIDFPNGHQNMVNTSLARAYEELGEFKSANDYYHRAIADGNFWAYKAFGTFLRQTGRLIEARQIFEKGISFAPSPDPELELGLADCLRSLREYDLAALRYRTAITLAPKCDAALIGLADVIAAKELKA